MKCRVIKVVPRKSDIYVWCRCEDRSKRCIHVYDFKPYFYVPSLLGDYVGIDGERLERVYADEPGQVPELRQKYEKHYEADVPYVQRFMIDSGITSGLEYPGKEASWKSLKPVEATDVPVLVWYLDIEVLADKMPSPERPLYPVPVITVYDSWENTFITWFYHSKAVKADRTFRVSVSGETITWRVKSFRNEEDMLMDFVFHYSRVKPDVVAGWNIAFDRDYLRARLKHYDFDLNTNHTCFLDMLEGYKTLGPRRRSYRLKYVTVEEGIESPEEAQTAEKFLSEYRENPIPLIKYNMRDVWRLIKIDKIYNIIDYFWTLKEVVGLPDIEDVYFTSTLVDVMLLRQAKEEGIVLPSKSKGQKAHYRGAIVLEPVPGIHENVAVFDMSRYYPSLIISFNISPETKWKPYDNEVWLFRQDREGLLPKMCRKLLGLREEIEAKMLEVPADSKEYLALSLKSSAVKAVTNAIYGYMAKRRGGNSRVYDPQIAGTITALGRRGILFIVKKAKEMGYQPLYGDTDSVFIKVPFEKAEELANILTREVRRYFKETYNLREEPVLKLKFEKYYRRIFFKPKTKKRYAGWLVWKKGKEVDELDIAGFEAVRTDVPPFTAEAQRRLFSLILREGLNKSKIHDFLRELQEEVRKKPLDEIALYEGLSKPLDEYKSNSPHVRAALYSNMYLGTNFGVGSKVKYVWVKSVKGLPATDVVAFEEPSQIEGKVEIDWSRQYQALISPILDILKSAGFTISSRVVSSRVWW